MRVKCNEFLNNLSKIPVYKNLSVCLPYAIFGEYISLRLHAVICKTHSTAKWLTIYNTLRQIRVVTDIVQVMIGQ